MKWESKFARYDDLTRFSFDLRIFALRICSCWSSDSFRWIGTGLNVTIAICSFLGSNGDGDRDLRVATTSGKVTLRSPSMPALETSDGIFEIRKVKAMSSNRWLVCAFYRSVGSCLRADENRKAESGGWWYLMDQRICCVSGLTAGWLSVDDLFAKANRRTFPGVLQRRL